MKAMRENQLKRKLQRGEVVLGPFMNCAYPAFIEICGHAGFDYAIIDMEHGPLNTLVAEDLCRAADGVGLAPIVRVRKNDAPQIQRALDHLMRGRTSFVIAQRISTVMNADLILVLERGRIAAQGRHADLMEDSPLYAEIYNSQLVGDVPVEAAAEVEVTNYVR